jgi:putative ABC transport system permease protein
MLKNYFKIAIAVLKRRKFFTFISLFGISFTLTIIMVLTAFIDNIGNSNYPDKKRARSLYVNMLVQTGKKTGYYSNGPYSYYFLDHFAGSLKTPVKVGISSMFDFSSTYVNNKKVSVNLKYTNAAYWEILENDFFIAGKPYSQQQVDQAQKVAVISEDTRNSYFGETKNVIGKYMEVANVKYRVIGVVKNVPITMYSFYADMYLPYTVSNRNYKDKSYGGNYSAVLLAKSEADVPKMKAEYENMVTKIPIVDNKDFDKLYSFADSYMTGFLRILLSDTSDSTMAKAILYMSVFLLLFLSLPTINLVNINITRIMERSSEIGVRKAFGASSKTLVYQFLVENIILTLMGGIIGALLSVVAIYAINQANLIANLQLSLNFSVLCVSLFVCLVFGLLSGVYPAWRMSRLSVATALKGQ